MDDELLALGECICSTVDLINNRNHSASLTEPEPETDQNVTSFDYCAFQGSAASNDPLRHVEELLFTRVIVAICALGVAGNVGNLLVLVPQGRRCAKGRIERSVYWGLVSLAVSDLFFCVSVIPKAFTERDPFVSRPDFSLAYAVYGDGLINVFIMASTWLTVAMAVGRYLAVCHPFRARQVIGATLTKRAVFAVYGAGVVCNAPRFFVYRVASIVCGQPPAAVEEFHFRWPGYVNVRRNPTLETVYMWWYFAVGVFLPCVLLSASNAFLVRALQGSTADAFLPSRRRRSRDPTGDQYRPVTVTLVALVAMYVILVSPAEIVIFMRHRFVADDVTYDDTYDLVAAVGNTLQAVNFSLNFVLYYVINVHFRRALSALVIRRCRRRRHSFGASLSLTESVSLNNVRRHRLTGYKMAELPVDSSPETVTMAAVQDV